MATLSKQLFFNAPLEKVWDILLDVERSPELVDGVKTSKIIKPMHDGKGLAWQETCQFAGLPIQAHHEITDSDPGKKTQIHSRLALGGVMNRAFVFRKTAEGSVVDLTVDWDLGMAASLLGEEKIYALINQSLILTVEKWKLKAEAKN